MSSSEEYLDNLLKSLTEGGSSINEEPSVSEEQDIVGTDDLQGTSAPEETDDTMSMEDIEAMLASMGEDIAEEEPQSAEAVLTDDGMLPDELALDESMLTEETGLDDGMLPDELALDESMLTEETGLDDGMLSDELALDESMLTEETGLDDGMLSDELALDESMLTEETGLDDGMLSDELGLGDETASDDLSLDELGLGDLGLEDLGLEELGLEEKGQDESEAGDGFALEGGAEADDSFALEETGEDDADLSALLASMSGDEDLSEINDLLEKSDQGIAIDDDMMALLGDASEGEEGGDSFDFFSGEEAAEDESKNIREITPEESVEKGNPKTKKQKKKEEKERKKREKQAKNKGASQDENADGEGADDLTGLLEGIGEPEGEPKKQGFFGRFLAFLLEEDDEEGETGIAVDDPEDTGVIIGNLSEENKELLAELKAEDQQKKKDKKGKKEKKSNKGKKGKKAEAAEGAEDGEGEEEGEAKPKKPKKEKKKKEKNVDEGPKVPEKKLSKKKVTSVFLFCATIAACIVVVTVLLPEQMEKQEARMAFDEDQYTQVYDLLYGKELNEEDEILLKKSSTILKVQRKLDSYENYTKMDMPLEALNALIEGVKRYQDLRSDAELYNVSGEIADVYTQILDALADNYGLSEADALDIISSGDDVTYSQRIRAVITGEVFGTEEPQPEGKQDVLPEEEEIIDRLQNN